MSPKSSPTFSFLLRTMPAEAAAARGAVDRSEPVELAGCRYVERVALARAANVALPSVAEFAQVRGMGIRLGTSWLVPLRFAICYTALQRMRPPARWLEVEGESLAQIAEDLFTQTERELDAAARQERSPRNLFTLDQVGRIWDFAVADKALALEAAKPRREAVWSSETLERLVRSHNRGLTRRASDVSD